jgi:hypothetical protein
MKKRGQPYLGNSESLRVAISPELESALDMLVQVSGVSKAAIVRQALSGYLASQGVLPEPKSTTITLTR